MATTKRARGDGRPRHEEATSLRTRDAGLRPARTCSQYNPRTMRYCRRGITMVGPGTNGDIFYCNQHGLEKGARPIEFTDEARAEAADRAHGWVPSDAVLDSTVAVRLYIEAFVAGAAFAAKQVGSPT